MLGVTKWCGDECREEMWGLLSPRGECGADIGLETVQRRLDNILF